MPLISPKDLRAGTIPVNVVVATATTGDSDTSIASTAFVQQELLANEATFTADFVNTGTLQNPIIELAVDPATKQDVISLTHTGTSGAATFVGNVLNIPVYGGGGGSPQTPWASDIDAADFALNNLSALDIRIPGTGGVTYATYDPAQTGAFIVLTNSNHTAKVSSFSGSVISTISKSSGKHYWEVTLDNASDNTIGIAKAAINLNGYVGDDSNGWSIYTNTSGYLLNNNSFDGLSTSFTNGDIIGCLLDLTAGTLTFYKNNVAIPGAQHTGLSGTFFAATGNSTNVGQTTTNFGTTAFIYAVPAGYAAGFFTGSGGPDIEVIHTDSTTGKVGIGTITPAEVLDVVGDVKYSGNLKPGGTAGTNGQFLKNIAGVDTWSSTVAATTVPLSGIIAAIAGASPNHADNQVTWQWNTLTDHTALLLSSSSTAAGSNSQNLLKVFMQGANATSSQTTRAAWFENQHTGTSSTNVAAIFSAINGTNNYAIIVPASGGSVAIGNSVPVSTLDVTGGSLGLSLVTKTADYTASANDYTILCSTNTFTITLPAAAGCTGRVYVIKNITSGTVVTIDPNASETLDGSTTKILNTQYSGYAIQSNGSAWFIISTF